MRASVGGHLEVCQALVNAKALVDVMNILGHTALRLAVTHGQHAVINTLVSCESDLTHHKGEVSLLGLAAQLGFPEVATALLEAGADPNEASVLNNVNWTPLLQACRHESHAVTTVLLAYGADPDEVSGATAASPTTLAARNGDSVALKTLLRAGAAVQMIDGAGYTPLMRAVQGGHLECVRCLLRCKAQADSPKDAYSRTALSLALAVEDPLLQSALLQALVCPLDESEEDSEWAGVDILGNKMIARQKLLARKFERVVKNALKGMREATVRGFRRAMRFMVAERKFQGGIVNNGIALELSLIHI
eukprot:TRINITY_DN40024_c0_g1_i2.p1 TRINITY_DN40024_c0_g1~~TRINITY_DN40024_c0_g1_i2.p1  ORF type:complete len:306 (+),score=44.78 TRINITY_DN40024_c0_g1_i2:176-1093(+)